MNKKFSLRNGEKIRFIAAVATTNLLYEAVRLYALIAEGILRLKA